MQELKQSDAGTCLRNPPGYTYRASPLSPSHRRLQCFYDAFTDEDCMQTNREHWLAICDTLHRLMASWNACQNWLHVPVLSEAPI